MFLIISLNVTVDELPFNKIAHHLAPEKALYIADNLFTDRILTLNFDETQFGPFYWLDPWRRAHRHLFYGNLDHPQLKSTNIRRRYLHKLHLSTHLALIRSHKLDNQQSDNANANFFAPITVQVFSGTNPALALGGATRRDHRITSFSRLLWQ
jgi:hypothetical protein